MIAPPRSPQANAIRERLNGALRRDCLDYVVALDEVHTQHILNEYLRYYHGRPQSGLRRAID